MRVTRRELAAALAAGAAMAQNQSRPSTPEEELKAARDRVRANGDALAKEQVPMSTEPAFQFKA
jgi:hypothetical protein